ncbi:MAG: hypothetical protein H0V40_04950 [Actinobacteria bacterium]|nr:hypothetical protein [Actinomycetota bacterium]
MSADEARLGGSAEEQSLRRAEELLARLEATRAELARLAEREDADETIAVLTELADIARQVEEELAQVRRGVDAQP